MATRRKNGQFAKKAGKRRKKRTSGKKRSAALKRRRDRFGHFLPSKKRRVRRSKLRKKR